MGTREVTPDEERRTKAAISAGMALMRMGAAVTFAPDLRAQYGPFPAAPSASRDDDR